MQVPISEEEIYPVYFEQEGESLRTVPTALWERYSIVRDEFFKLNGELTNFFREMEKNK